MTPPQPPMRPPSGCGEHQRAAPGRRLHARCRRSPGLRPGHPRDHQPVRGAGRGRPLHWALASVGAQLHRSRIDNLWRAAARRCRASRLSMRLRWSCAPTDARAQWRCASSPSVGGAVDDREGVWSKSCSPATSSEAPAPRSSSLVFHHRRWACASARVRPASPSCSSNSRACAGSKDYDGPADRARTAGPARHRTTIGSARWTPAGPG